MALNDLAVKASKPKDKPFKLSDTKGLYLYVQPSGGKLWRFDYRFNSKRKTLAFGGYPDVSLGQARERRDLARKLLAEDPPIDPSENRKADKISIENSNQNTFEFIAREWWQSHMLGKAASHKNKVMRRFETYLFPWLGNKPIAEITAPEFLKVVMLIVNQNKIETAHRTLQTSGQAFRYAIQTGKADRDVTSGLKGALPTSEVKHMAAFTEPDEIAQYLVAIKAFSGTFTVLCALQLAPLFWCRPGELRHARWSEIDFENNEWRYFVGKTKIDHLVPLSKQAINILKSLYNFSGHGEYVFSGGRDPRRPMSEAAVNAALRRLGYDTQTEITGHGFRATARTILHERLNIDPHIIEHQLAHRVPDNLGSAYNRTKFIDQRKIMMQQWADYLDDLRN
jgi:integrase